MHPVSDAFRQAIVSCAQRAVVRVDSDMEAMDLATSAQSCAHKAARVCHSSA